MPCTNSNHNHETWPTSGKAQFHIAACETKCGWCSYKTKAANNLRVHARRHIANPKERHLLNVRIASGRAGRIRVTSNSVDTLISSTANITSREFPDIELGRDPDRESCDPETRRNDSSVAEDLRSFQEATKESLDMLMELLHDEGFNIELWQDKDGFIYSDAIMIHRLKTGQEVKCCGKGWGYLFTLLAHISEQHAQAPDKQALPTSNVDNSTIITDLSLTESSEGHRVHQSTSSLSNFESLSPEPRLGHDYSPSPPVLLPHIQSDTWDLTNHLRRSGT